MIKWLSYGIGGLIGLILIAALLAPIVVPGSYYKSILETQASEALARDVQLSEAPSFRLLPAPAFKVNGLTISNAPGFSAEHFAEVEEARIKVKLWPLFVRRAEIDELVLIRPEISLEKKPDGTVNWLLGAPNDTPDENAQPSGAPAGDVRLGDARLVDGKIIFQDQSSNQIFTAEAVNLTLALKTLAKPLTVNGDMIFQGTPAKLYAKATTPKSLMKNQPSSLELKIELADNLIDTTINLAGGAHAYDGNLKVDAPTLRSLLATLGAPIEVEKGFERLKLSGAISGGENYLSFKNAELSFDAIQGNGDLDFSWGGARPKVDGQLRLSSLDLRPYLPLPDEAARANKRDKNAPFPAWSEEKMSFDFLRTVDGNFTVEADEILLHDISFGKSALTANMRGGKLTADLDALTLYGGAGEGQMIVDATSAMPVMRGNFVMQGLDARDFASSVMGLNRLGGRGDLTITFATTGNSQAALMRALDGGGAFDLQEGVLEGVDLGGMTKSVVEIVKGLQAGEFNRTAFASAIASARGDGAKTDFSALAAAFTMDNGIVTTRDITLTGPYFTLSGSGSIDLPAQSLSLKLAPVLSQMQDGSGGSFSIPLQVAGGFNGASISVDVQSLIRQLTDNRLRGLLQKNGIPVPDSGSLGDVIRGAAEDRLQDALGLPASEDEDAGLEDQLKDRANEELGKLLGGGDAPADDPAPKNNDENNDEEAQSEPEAEASQPQSLEDIARERAEQELGKALGLPFGSSSDDTEAGEEEDPQTNP
jgi:AsmA protein